MMKLLRTLSFSLFLFSFAFAFSQNFEVPKNVEYKTADDYVKYEKDVIAAAKWLVSTPLVDQLDKRQEVSAFVIGWINGSPTVMVEITPIIMDFESKNSGMLVVYMASCARYVLENNYSTDVTAKHKYALDAMMKVYERGQGITKDKKMLKLIKAKSEGKMDAWLEKNMKVS